MGVRTVRYCDITGIASDDVTHHELQIDQMRVEIDLVEAEYQRLLQALQPFIDAGRVDASIPTPPAASPTGPVQRTVVPARHAGPQRPAGWAL